MNQFMFANFAIVVVDVVVVVAEIYFLTADSLKKILFKEIM